MNRKKSLYLVDVSSMFFRAFYAVRPLSSPSGLPVNAIYGFLTMTIKLLREIRPDYVAFCFDRPEPSFRKDIDQRYKANRTEMPEDLVPQMPWFRKLSESLGVKCFDKIGFEADDIIGTLTKAGQDRGLDVVIVSGDKDFAQLINSDVTLYDTMKDVRYDSALALEKWGVPPQKMIDYLALVGDSSDNVAGVAGIGPKGAQKLLAEYASLEEIYNKLDSVKPDGTRKKLEASRDEAFLSKRLVTIVQDVPLEYELEELRLHPIEREKVLPLFEELGFKSLSRQLFGTENSAYGDTATKSTSNSTAKSNSTSTSSSSASSNSDSRQAGGAGGEIEGVSSESPLRPGPYWPEARLEISELSKLLAQRDPSKEIWVLHSERGVVAGLDGTAYQLAGSPEDLGRALEGRRLSGYDIKDFAHRYQLRKFEVEWDARLGAYVEHAGAVESIHELFTRYLGLALPDLASPSQWLAWNFALRRAIEIRLEKSNGMKVLKELDLPLVPVLYRMEKRGILIDLNLLSNFSRELAADIQSFEAQIHQACGEIFNIGSPKQLGQILFGKMGLPSGKKTKTGFSTDNEVLEAIDHPVAKLILNWREVTKLKSTYVDAIPQLADAGGRVHTTFNQAHTTTGRLSSVNPNLQNIPIRTERGAHIRKSFIAPKGRMLVSADYSQIELRILAEITEDPGLVRAFEKGHDIHAATAAEIFEVPLADVTSEMRRQAKAVNFGLAYGQGAFGLAETLGVTRAEAQAIILRYFTRFAKVKEYMTETVENAKKVGYVETLFGRRRYLIEFESKNAAIRKFGERAAINAPIQGTASDLVKKAMIDVEQVSGEGTGLEMLLQVHDELVFEADENLSDAKLHQIRELMQGAAKFKVPLVANIGQGHSWQDAH